MRRRQLSLYAPEPQRSVIDAVRAVLDPVQHRLIPAHVTLCREDELAGIDAAVMAERLAGAAPITLRFGPPERFIGRNIVSLRLDPHGPLRALHEALATCGLPFGPTRWPFTPHCTLNLYPELTAEKLRAMLAVRIEEPFTVQTLKVYHTREPQPPVLLLTLPLEG